MVTRWKKRRFRFHRRRRPPTTARSPPCTIPSGAFTPLQFHPEVVHTPWGTEVIRGFVEKVCGTQRLWTMESFIEQQRRASSASRLEPAKSSAA